MTLSIDPCRPACLPAMRFFGNVRISRGSPLRPWALVAAGLLAAVAAAHMSGCAALGW